MPGFPGQLFVCTTILDPSDSSMTTCVSGGLYGNLYNVKTECMTFLTLGCSREVVPVRRLAWERTCTS